MYSLFKMSTSCAPLHELQPCSMQAVKARHDPMSGIHQPLLMDDGTRQHAAPGLNWTAPDWQN